MKAPLVPRSTNTATYVAGVSKQQPAPGKRVGHPAPRRRAPGGSPATLRAHGGLGRIRHRIYEPEYLVILALAILSITAAAKAATGSDYLRAAQGAARWIRSTETSSEAGPSWPVDPETGQSEPNLYSGVAGLIPFFLELHYRTGDEQYLAEASRAGDYLIRESLGSADSPAGLYTGLAGTGFVLSELFKAGRREKYRQAALAATARLRQSALVTGAGIQWNDSTDIISGSAGIGLFLLYAERELGVPGSVQAATRAGDRLLEVARPAGPGLKWAMSPDFPRLMPNFSHGTAGVAYFLATLYQHTGEERFLRAARAGAHYLLSIAETAGGSCLIFHHEPDGKDLHYLSWCHGPAGTARLFYRLWEITGEQRWLDWVHRSARAIRVSGIPEQKTAGFWNNLGQCCGSAGVGEFFTSLYLESGQKDYLMFAQQVAVQILENASRTATGLRWIHAEHRVRPDETAAQTGFMQGAAGIGTFLVHLELAFRGRRARIVFPDNPFGGRGGNSPR